MKLFLAPHNDDETLFGAFTLMKEKPLVVIVTDSWKQFTRGEEHITADVRWEETQKAMAILGCPVIRLGIRDDVIDDRAVREKLKNFVGFERVYAPAIQGGNEHHDIVGRVADELFGDIVTHYCTYSKDELYTTGLTEITATPEEQSKKQMALMCYKTQLELLATKPHFDAVDGRSEWYT